MTDLAGFGVWSPWLRFGDDRDVRDAVAELDDLGFTAVWIPGVAGGEDLFPAVRRLLSASARMTIATGVLNIWAHRADQVADECASLAADHGDRFLLGLGVSHAALVPNRYERPLDAMRRYLDELDAHESTRRERRCLAALGPKMLELAATRAAGAHPYNVTPMHTRWARETMGADALLAPEHAAVLLSDPGEARAVARGRLADYLGRLPNYDRNLRRLGYASADLEAGGSDRLVDDLVAWGDEKTVASRLREHHAAGADHVCVQVLGADGGSVRDAWRRLAGGLDLLG
jgi:probable F420-dependent oxidoreductase